MDGPQVHGEVPEQKNCPGAATAGAASSGAYRNQDTLADGAAPASDEHHGKCPRNTLGASRKNARETVIVVGHGKWAVDVVSC